VGSVFFRGAKNIPGLAFSTTAAVWTADGVDRCDGLIVKLISNERQSNKERASERWRGCGRMVSTYTLPCEASYQCESAALERPESSSHQASQCLRWWHRSRARSSVRMRMGALLRSHAHSRTLSSVFSGSSNSDRLYGSKPACRLRSMNTKIFRARRVQGVNEGHASQGERARESERTLNIQTVKSGSTSTWKTNEGCQSRR